MDMEESVGLRECNKIHDKLEDLYRNVHVCTQANTEVRENKGYNTNIITHKKRWENV